MLLGGPGADVLIGGAGRDRFDFGSTLELHASDEAPATSVAAAFEGPGAARATVIDLSAIDANAGRAATRTSSSAAQATGHLRLLDRDGDTLVCGNTAGSVRLDFGSASRTATTLRGRLHRRRLHPLAPSRAAARIRYAWHRSPRSSCPTSACPALGAEMRHVDQRRRIVGQHPQHRARRQRRQALARLQHRQRAEQPAGVELGVPGHGAELAAAAAALSTAM